MEHKLVPLSEVEQGIKEYLTNSKNFLAAAKVTYENGFTPQALSLYYYALRNFGNAVLLRDKKKIAELKNQKEIEISDTYNDATKSVESAIRTCGPHVDILNQKRFSSQIKSDKQNNSDSHTIDPLNVFLIHFEDSSKKWKLFEPLPESNEIKKVLLILKKMLDRWDLMY